jgi:PH (Pleckstrin Homology) domain-containing protein
VAGTVTPPRPPVVVVRPVTVGAPVAPVPPTPSPRLPFDPFPPQFLEPGERVLTSVKPRIRAFLGLPALAIGAISLASLAAVSLVAGSSGPETGLFVLFVLTFVLNNVVWSRWIGRGLLALLPLSFLVGFIVEAAVTALTGSIDSGQTRQIVAAELPVFAFLELLFPLAVFLLAWFHRFYAVTDQRVIVVSGLYTRSSDWLALANVGPVTVRQSFVGRWLGYGRIRFVDQSPRTGVRHGLAALVQGRAIVGAEFFGVPEPEVFRGQLEAIVAPARRSEPAPGGPPPAMVPPPVSPAVPPSPTPPASAAASAATAPSPGVARCPRCGTAVIYVAPASRFYCPTCGRYT